MKNIFLILAIVFTIMILLSRISISADPAASSGESLFMKNCQICHKDGGNIINPKKTLSLQDRKANKMTTVEALIKNMRNPGPGMTSFDEKTISNAEARAIAEYVIKTFK